MKRLAQTLLAAVAMTAAAAPAAASYVTLREAEAISQSINDRMAFVAEAPGMDDWQTGQAAGDCEDFALTKRAALIEAGMAPERIRILVLRNDKGGHAVLTVRVNSMVYVFERYRGSAPTVLQTFLKTNRFKVFCEARDLSAGNKPASARC